FVTVRQNQSAPLRQGGFEFGRRFRSLLTRFVLSSSRSNRTGYYDTCDDGVLQQSCHFLGILLGCPSLVHRSTPGASFAFDEDLKTTRHLCQQPSMRSAIAILLRAIRHLRQHPSVLGEDL